MIYFGSGAEYNRNYGKPLILESDFGNCMPQDPYGLAKYIEAKLVNNHDNIYDLCLFGVYGKYEEWQRRFISNNIARSLLGLPMTLTKNAMFDYLYVEDLCKIVEWFIEHDPKYKHYNVCTSRPVALLSLAKMINEVSGLDREILIAKEGWQPEYSGDNHRLLAEIGEFVFTDKKKSIEEMWNYFEEHRDELEERQLLL
jgi:GDP-L-fucose synthase